MLDQPYDDRIPVYNAQTVRDIVTVYGELTVNGGILEAGRSKKQYVTDGEYELRDVTTKGSDRYVNGTDTFDGYAYQQTWGSAVTVKSGGKFTTFGGEFYGRGEGYYSESVIAGSAYVDGVVWEQGEPTQIIDNPQRPETREFLSRFTRH